MENRTDSYRKEFSYYCSEKEKEKIYDWLRHCVDVCIIGLKAQQLDPELIIVEFKHKPRTENEPAELSCFYCINHIEYCSNLP